LLCTPLSQDNFPVPHPCDVFFPQVACSVPCQLDPGNLNHAQAIFMQ
jgi:hypothetical protein